MTYGNGFLGLKPVALMNSSNVKEFGIAGGSFGKRCLFFLTTFFP